MIELGLQRMSTLLKHTQLPFKAFHVAGTNGKGSICAYLSAMLRAGGLTCGTFTSPYLIDRWDCINIDGHPVDRGNFETTEKQIQQRAHDCHVQPTEFELLTATAFEIFRRQQVEVAVIEVGLGGRLDATNALRQKAATIISKIGLDHQAFLGNTLEEIAYEKAGILLPGVPCIVDSTNPQSVLDVVQKRANELGVSITLADSRSDNFATKYNHDFPNRMQPHQLQNLACAYEALRQVYPNGLDLQVPKAKTQQNADIQKPLGQGFGLRHAGEEDKEYQMLSSAIHGVSWPGRLQQLSIKPIFGREADVLLDGAHNAQSAQVLSWFVNEKLRSDHQPVTWVLAASAGKDLGEILRILLREGDSIAAVEFGPVDGMPWVKPMDSSMVLKIASESGAMLSQQHSAGRDITSALSWATQTSHEGPLVIAGSLYLVSDVLRILKENPTHQNSS
ncbi:Mur ligase [Xylariaceae sp. FL0016]|nr:Mur ligase [Xylariaceae sp. FL0016]